jgi:hypothetical protein
MEKKGHIFIWKCSPLYYKQIFVPLTLVWALYSAQKGDKTCGAQVFHFQKKKKKPPSKK